MAQKIPESILNPNTQLGRSLQSIHRYYRGVRIMKRALIDGMRIAQIVNVGDEFEVTSSLQWVVVPDDTSDRDTYENRVVVKADVYTPSTSVDEAHERKRMSLVGVFKNARDAGTTVKIAGSGISIATTHKAQQELRELVMHLAISGTQKGVTRSGTPIVFNEAIAKQCLGALNNHYEACNNNEYDHLVAILALNTITDIDAYDVTTNWPGIT